MSSKPKKAASKKTASKAKATAKAAPPSSAKAPTKESSPKKAAAVDGVNQARLRRLKRAGFSGADRCALLGIRLDTGPRASNWQRPVQFGCDVVCLLAERLLDLEETPEALEPAAARLRSRGES